MGRELHAVASWESLTSVFVLSVRFDFTELAFMSFISDSVEVNLFTGRSWRIHVNSLKKTDQVKFGFHIGNESVIRTRFKYVQTTYVNKIDCLSFYLTLKSLVV